MGLKRGNFNGIMYKNKFIIYSVFFKIIVLAVPELNGSSVITTTFP